MINRIIDFIKKYNLQDKTIIVGFSGGFDSMCLLHVLSKIKELPEFCQMRVIAAHYNHNWRGEEALQEQEVCRIFASSVGVEFYTKNAPSTLKKTENDARIARYEFFEEAYEEFDADAVFTAHNKDDNAETVLYRIIKGTGVYGLKGIAEKRMYFYRPLLSTYRSEIVNYCSENNLSPNIDSSNSNTAYKRNYLRLNVIPALEKVNDNVKDALNTLALNAINDSAVIEEYLDIIRKNVFDGDRIISSKYKELSKPVKLRILYGYILSLGLDYDYKKICEIYNFVEGNITQRNGATHSLATALWLYADDKIVETIPRKSANIFKFTNEIKINGIGEYDVGGKTFIIKPANKDDLFIFPEASANFAYVDLSKISFPLVLRTRRDGDSITPFGMKGSMKLKKYMNAKGIQRHKRDEVILLCDGSEVLWAAGVGLSNKIGVDDKPTHVIEIV
ncbi:tRNA lysidine(34) synthetase TilS [bacterium]|nr:tRNA lysidine(34) synthetase TilS [bacterium]